jgi:ribonuclease P/MRP protein subunit RPP1
MIIAKDINEARKQIQKLKTEGKEVIVLAGDPEFNRKILEIKDVNMLLSPEIHNRKEPLKERDSGLNEVLCDIAAKNNIKIGIDLDIIRKLPDEQKAKVLARLQQNIMLCKKSGTEIILFGKYDKKDAFSFLLTLGASTEQAKKAVEKE